MAGKLNLASQPTDHVSFSRAAPQADDFDLNPYANKPRLTFTKDGTFKITVFSDLHFGENPWDAWGPQQDVNSIQLMNTVLTSEKPDYVSVSAFRQSLPQLRLIWSTLQRPQR